jgi:transcriptional regulator with XRE-family HTH domain
MKDLKGLRRRRLLTQKELAAQVGVTHQTVQSWESGRARPRLRHIRRLAEVLDVPAISLLPEDEEPSAPPANPSKTRTRTSGTTVQAAEPVKQSSALAFPG